jgi:hypothetical protein
MYGSMYVSEIVTILQLPSSIHTGTVSHAVAQHTCKVAVLALHWAWALQEFPQPSEQIHASAFLCQDAHMTIT